MSTNSNPTAERTNPLALRLRHPRTAMTAGVVALGVLLAACGSDDDTDASVDEAPAAQDPGEATTDPVAVSISTGPTGVGDVLVDGDGLSLYGFLPDEGGTPTCGGGCAEAWPPVILPDDELPEGLDADVFAITDGIDGGSHLMAGGWPLYRFAGDASSGDITGQGSGGNWFLVAPDGSLITDEAAAPAPSGDTEITDTESSGRTGY